MEMRVTRHFRSGAWFAILTVEAATMAANGIST